MTMGEGRRRGYNDFLLRMSSSISKRWVCVVENLSRVYIVWVKGKKVTLKNPSGRMFHDYLAGRPYPRDTCGIDNLAQLFGF